MDLAYELPSGIKFRSVEFENIAGNHAQHILNGCVSTLETLTIVLRGTGTYQLSFPPSAIAEWLAKFIPTGDEELGGLRLTEINGFRRLALRLPSYQTSTPINLVEALSTVTSLVFREFVLELGTYPSWFNTPSSMHRNRWEEVDKLFVERFAERGNFKVIIRTGELSDRESFQQYVKESFPLLARRGSIHFETSHD
jgi:hypothetical protein